MLDLSFSHHPSPLLLVKAMASGPTLLPPRVNVPATPALEGIDIRTLYDIDHATLLGKGGFSEVLAVRHIPSGEMRALKVMNREALVGKKGEMVAHEKEILRRTCHPNIVTLYETIQNPEKVYFALDLMNEDLFEFIVRNKRVNEALTRKIMFYLLSGVNYLHEQSVVHRDIKPENLLINVLYKGDGSDGAGESDAGDGSDSFENIPPNQMPNVNELDQNKVDVEIKLADFGLAKVVMEWDVRSTPCGTSFYIAPEIIRGIESQGAKPLCTNQRLVKSVDIWSSGVVLYVLLSGRPPFHGQVKTGEERRALLRKIDHGVLFNPDHGWNDISGEAKDLILRMLDQDTARRISAAEALQHPFFTAHGFTKPIPGGDPRQRQREELQRKQQTLRLQREQQAAKEHIPAPPSRLTAKDDEARKSAPTQPSVNSGSEGDSSSASRSGQSHKKRGLFSGMKHFFSGGSHKDAATREEEQRMHDELAELQKEVIQAEDAEGDVTSYRPTMPVLESKPSRPAVMNTKAKVGPAALKK